MGILSFASNRYYSSASTYMTLLEIVFMCIAQIASMVLVINDCDGKEERIWYWCAMLIFVSHIVVNAFYVKRFLGYTSVFSLASVSFYSLSTKPARSTLDAESSTSESDDEDEEA